MIEALILQRLKEEGHENFMQAVNNTSGGS